MKNKVGFDFEEVDLTEAQNVVRAGVGNYASLKAVLLEKLPQLAPDKALAFGLPDHKEVDEKSRRGICTAVNAVLKKSALGWRVTYSSLKNLFVCVPQMGKNGVPVNARKVPLKYQKFSPQDVKEILELKRKGQTNQQIGRILNVSTKRIYMFFWHEKRKRLRMKKGRIK